ncbi:MAG: 6-carboxytetrahydropterin synthase [Planctomycetota bacterium]
MITLRRTVRFSLNPDAPSEASSQSPAVNGFGGHPSMRGFGRYYELEAGCRGRVNPETGYLINIKEVDDAIRTSAIPALARIIERDPTREPADAMPDVWAAARGAMGDLLGRLKLLLTPYYSVTMRDDMPDTVILRQRFDFAASHRLHVPTMSDEENRRVFGKCNHVTGHGHNYQVEPSVAVTVGAEPPLSLHELEQITDRVLIDPFDHKYLNEDTPEFATDGGVNPSVENIAKVFFHKLAAEVDRPGVRLQALTVWETDRTSCTYPAAEDDRGTQERRY